MRPVAGTSLSCKCTSWLCVNIENTSIRYWLNEMEQETHEQRSCLRKRRFDAEPTDELQGDYFYAYECGYCGGWHLATAAKRRNGDLRYTKEGWPVVPYCGPAR